MKILSLLYVLFENLTVYLLDFCLFIGRYIKCCFTLQFGRRHRQRKFCKLKNQTDSDLHPVHLLRLSGRCVFNGRAKLKVLNLWVSVIKVMALQAAECACSHAAPYVGAWRLRTRGRRRAGEPCWRRKRRKRAMHVNRLGTPPAPSETITWQWVWLMPVVSHQ